MIGYWVRGTFFTAFVGVKNGVIVETAPILWKFRGQPFANLASWSKVIEIRSIPV